MKVETAMTAAQINSALGTRRTVRVTYSRTTDTYNISIMFGEQVDTDIANIYGGSEGDAESLAETIAAEFAEFHHCDITRIDVA